MLLPDARCGSRIADVKNCNKLGAVRGELLWEEGSGYDITVTVYVHGSVCMGIF
jgi:hypothetical protein